MILSDKEKIILKANDFSVGKNNLLHKTNLFKSKKVKKIRVKKSKEKKFGIILQIYKPGEFNIGQSLKGKKFFN
jgi:hypothetical protein